MYHFWLLFLFRTGVFDYTCWTFYALKGSLTSVAFSPDGKQLVTGGRDDTIRVWDGATGVKTKEIKGHGGSSSVQSIAFSPDGQHVVTGEADGVVRVWDVVLGAQVRIMKRHKSEVNSVAFSPEGNQIASGSRDRTVRIWDFVFVVYVLVLITKTLTLFITPLNVPTGHIPLTDPLSLAVAGGEESFSNDLM